MTAGQFLEVISGIRCLLSYSIIALCVFKENVMGKKVILDIPLYMFAIFMHDSCFVLALISIVIYIFKSNNKIIKKAFYFVLLALGALFLITKNHDYILSLTTHANTYISGVDSYGRTTYFYFWEYLIALLCMIFMGYSLLKYNKIGKKIDKSYIITITIVLLITFIFSFEFSIFERFRTYLMILNIPLIGNVFSNAKLNNNLFQKNNYNTVFIFFTIMIYSIAVTRGFLCNLKFFE